MPSATRDIPAIERALTDASVEHDGRRYVRASVACGLIGVSRSMTRHWVHLGWVRPLRFRVPRSKRAPQGIVHAWALEDAIAAARRHRPLREIRWTQSEDETIENHTGWLSYAAIARRLGRTPDAVRRRAIKLGVTHRGVMGLLTTTEAGRLCGASKPTVARWCDRGLLRHRTEPSGVRAKLIHPRDLLACVRKCPRVWKRMTPARIARLEHLAADRHDALGPPKRRAA
ncbi:MAG: helix-turn-helix domain-containing protein [Planctomycetota bacterium]